MVWVGSTGGSGPDAVESEVVLLMPTLRLSSRPLPYGKLLAIFVSSIAALALASGASAGPIVPGTYQLFDHGDGGLGPDYGLRVDALESELGISEVYFSFEQGGASVTLTWDGSVGAGSSATTP